MVPYSPHNGLESLNRYDINSWKPAQDKLHYTKLWRGFSSPLSPSLLSTFFRTIGQHGVYWRTLQHRCFFISYTPSSPIFISFSQFPIRYPMDPVDGWMVCYRSFGRCLYFLRRRSSLWSWSMMIIIQRRLGLIAWREDMAYRQRNGRWSELWSTG